MSVDTTIAVLYAQTGLGTQFAHAAAVAPHAQAAMTRVLALETAKQEQHLIEKTNETEEKTVSKDGRQKQGKQTFGSRRRLRAKGKEETEETPRTMPYTGNLLNLTV
ncbi:MAG: hypothetical protein IK079_01095 [Desulfovibrio sp.]|nr:hypothetical protein [Desulfovibrio sp.]